MHDLLGLGCVAVDDLLYLEQFPEPDAKVRVQARQRQCGGLTANALVAAARLGARCAYAGTLGDDEASQFVRHTLQREGVDLTWLRHADGARPIRSTILVEQARHTRTILFDLTGSVGAATDWPPEEVFRASRVLHVDHYGLEGMIRAARLARAAGMAVVCDLERDEWPGFEELFALVDHVVVNREFAGKRTGCPDAAAAAQALWQPGRQAVVVTCGDEGCWVLAAGQQAPWHQPAFAVPVIDTTGCGDVFHGAYAAALARGLPVHERVRVASAAAALKSTRPGAQAGCPTWAEVEELLRR
jgi:sugar/nucleoside kinase (ribokinase family)